MPIQNLSIFTRLQSYGRGLPIKCPTDGERDFDYAFPDGRSLRFNVPSYGYNVFIGGWERNTPAVDPMHEAKAAEPSSLITFADGVSGFKGRGRFGFCIQHPYPDDGSVQRDAYGAPQVGALFPAIDRHNNGANYVFFDGHVKWMPATDRSVWGRRVDDVPRAWLPNPEGPSPFTP